MFAAYAHEEQNSSGSPKPPTFASFNSACATDEKTAQTSWLQNASYVKPSTSDDIEEVLSDSSDVLVDKEVVGLDAKSAVLIVDEKPKKRKKKKKRKEEEIAVVEAKQQKSSVPETVKWSFQNEPSWLLDAHGDMQNYQYASTYKREVARYVARNLPPFILPRHLRDSKGLAERIKELRESRYYSKTQIRKLAKARTTVVKCRPSKRPRPLSGTVDLEREVVTDEQTGQEMEYDEELQMYKPIAAEESGEDDSLTALGRRERTLKALVEQTPTDVQSWLSLVRLQPRLLEEQAASTDDTKPMTSKATRRYAAERQIAMLDRALEKNPASVEMRLVRLTTAIDASLWDEAKVQAEWRDLLFKHVNSIKVWHAWLRHCRANYRTFTITSMSSIYDNCIDKLQFVLSGKLATHKPEPATSTTLVDIVLQKIEMLLQSGHTERAIACVQALVEYSLFTRNAPDTATCRAHFEVWWSDRRARFGERGSKGWCNDDGKGASTSEGNDAALIEAESDLLKRPLNGEHDNAKRTGLLWHEIETLRQHYQWAAAELSDDVADPERVVLFDDVKTMCIDVNNEDDKWHLLLGVLRLLSVRLPTIEESTKDNCDVSTFTSLFPDYMLERLTTLYDAVDFEQFITNAINLLRTRLYASDQYRSAYLAAALLRTKLFMYLMLASDGTFLFASWVILATRKQSDKERRRTLKSAAKDIMQSIGTDSIVLYIEYALILAELGAVDMQEQTLRAALQMLAPLLQRYFAGEDVTSSHFELLVGVKQLGEVKHMNVRLVRSRELGELPSVVYDVASFVYPKEDTRGATRAVKLLRAAAARRRTAFEQLSNSVAGNISVNDWRLGERWLGSVAELMTLLEAHLRFLASSGSKIDECIQQLDEGAIALTDALSNPTRQHLKIGCERLHIARALLYKRHSQLCATAPPKRIKESLTHSVSLYPYNATLIVHFVDSYAVTLDRFKLRLHFKRFSDDANDSITHLFGSIYTECFQHPQQTSKMSSITMETVRNRLRDATDTQPHCWQLWLLWMRLEAEHASDRWQGAQKERGVNRLDGVFYRAVNACPYVKVLYTYYLQHVPAQLGTVVDLLSEKQLRLRLPLEELQLLMREAQLPYNDGRSRTLQETEESTL